MAWADVLVDIKGIVDKRAITRDLSDAGDAGGKAAGSKFAGGFDKEAAPRLRAAHGRFGGDAEKISGRSGTSAGRAFASTFNIEFSKAAKAGIAKTLQGIGPAIPGMGAKAGGLLAGGGVALGALPALLAGAGAGAGALGGAATIGLGAKTLIGEKNKAGQPATQGPLYDQAQQIAKTFTTAMQQAATGMLAPLKQAFAQLPGIIRSLTPAMTQVFAGAGTMIAPLLSSLTRLAQAVLPQVGQVFRATAPLIQPLISGLTGLITGILPGLITLLKAAQPAVQALSGVLTILGQGIGQMLAAFAPAITASASILTSLGNILGALLPVIGQLAAVFAQALAPVFAAFASAVQALLPFLVTAGRVLADLAGAVLGVLATAFQALASLLSAIAPALNAFAGALSGAFTVLENSGVFTAFGNALMAVVPVIAQLVTAILNGLTPLLPPLIQFFGQIAAVMAGIFTQALNTIIPPLIQLAKTVFAALAKILPQILPLIVTLAQTLGTALSGALAQLMPALVQLATVVLSAIAKILPPVIGLFQQILPPIIQLAGIFAGALAQALTVIIPPLVQIATVILQALAKILPQILPPLVSLAQTMAGVLAGALTAVLPPLVQLATIVAQALAKILPVIVPPLAQIASTMAGVLAGALTKILPPLIQLATQVFTAIAGILPQLLPPLVQLAQVFAQSLAQVLPQILPAFVQLAQAFGKLLIALLPILPPLITIAAKLLELAVQVLVPIVVPVINLLIGILAGLVTGLANVITWVLKLPGYFSQAWTAVQTAMTTAWQFIYANVITPIGNFFTKTLPGWLTAGYNFVVSNFWNPVKNAFVTAWQWVYNTVLVPIQTFFTKTLPGWLTTAYNFVVTNFITPFKTGLQAMWTWVYNTVLVPIQTFFTRTLPGWLTTAYNFVVSTFITPFKTGIQGMWNWVYANVWTPLHTFFTATMPGWLKTAYNFVVSNFITPFKNGIKGAWDWVVGNVFNPMKTFITVTIPGWFSSAVKGITGAWNAIKGAVGTPINIVVGFLNTLIHGVNVILSNVGVKGKGPGGGPIPGIPTVKWAEGGLIPGYAKGGLLPGYGGGDIIPAWIRGGGPALLEPGEAVIDKRTTREHYGEIASWGVPGFRRGGVIPGFADGGMWRKLWAAVQGSGIPSLSLTSAYRPGDSGYHGSGNAIDVGGPDTGSTDPNTPMNRLYRWIYANYHASTELIHWPYGGIKNGRDVAGSFWPTSVWLQHKNHVHWAEAFAAGTPGGALAKGAGAVASVVVSSIEDLLASGVLPGPVGAAVKAVLGTGKLAAGGFGVISQLVQGLAGKAVSAAIGWLKGKAFQLLLGKYGAALTGTTPAATGQGGTAQAIARRLLASMGWSAQWPAFNALVSGESGWRVNATNPSSGAYGLPQALPPSKMAWAGADWRTNPETQLVWMLHYIQCFTLDTVILTRGGWKTYDQVKPGDETIGYNPETGRNEWTTITDINVYDDAPLVRLTNKTWEATCTPNHRWVISRLRQVDTRRCDGHGNRIPGPPSTSYRTDEIVPVNELRQRDQIRLAAPADTGGGPPISLGEAELLGWVLGDGSVSGYGTRRDPQGPLAEKILQAAAEHPQASHRAIARMTGCTHQTVGAYLRANGHTDDGARGRTGTGSMRRITISQAKAAGIEEIDALLNTEKILFSRHEYAAYGIARLRGVKWILRASYSDELLKRSGYDHQNPVSFVLSLSPVQREAFLRGVFGAEGWDEPDTMLNGRIMRGSRSCSQADGPQQDAIVLAIYLSGRRPAIRNWALGQGGDLRKRDGANIGDTKPFVTVQYVKTEDAGTAGVWCPTTELGSWTARQGWQVFLTGNSTYGNPNNAYAKWLSRSPHWYDRGGAINEPVLGVGRYSRTLYGFGGSGREWVIPESDFKRGGDGPGLGQVVQLLRLLVDTTAAVPARTGQHVTAGLNSTAAAAAYRSRYPAGGI